MRARLARGFAFGALLLLPGLAHAGAWNRQKGGFYIKSGYDHLRADELATPAGEVVPIPAFTRDEGTLYAEYGVSGRLSPAGFGDAVTYLAFGPGIFVEVARGIFLQLDVDGATNVRHIAKGPTARLGLSVSR